ncbi:hypothetical protein AU195_16555 [Mycobacterium sp. IS-1496]|uniref:PE-PPE domain-containing protein n=1 Tax=Mycobacterium sp. IS-1496 TaxID=1772284 RepID=UPI000741709E|nr:PE-PPE domain-containing protein [Mycobacterium sp. IS-1496]KUI38208.1 hypothetical protein AU195_16555 [Mycobacterium sp. IS-1496]
MTAGLALGGAALFGFAYAAGSHAPSVGLLATTIFIEGTRDIYPTGEPEQGWDRMEDSLDGAYTQPGTNVQYDGTGTFPLGSNVFIDYSRAMGVLTGANDPLYDASKAEATDRTIKAIKTARAQNPNEEIVVVGFSQGSGAATDAIEQLEKEDYDTSGITFVLTGNGTRNNGGFWAGLPPGVYVPVLGISFGDATIPGNTKIIQVSKQYDGVSDSPKYMFNLVAGANAIMGQYYQHNDYYRDVKLDYNGDGSVNQADFDKMEDEGYATVTYSKETIKDENGVDTGQPVVTDVLILNQPGDLPLLRPLRDLGVPDAIVDSLEPFFRAIIETGYDRPTDGVYPSKPVMFHILPGPHQWVDDAHAIGEGLDDSHEQLAAAVTAPQPAPLTTRSTQTAGSFSTAFTPQFLPAPKTAYTQPPALVQTGATQAPVVPAGGTTSSTTAPTGGAPAGGTQNLPGLKAFNKVVTGVAKSITQALTPKKTTGGSTGTGTTGTGSGTEDTGPTTGGSTTTEGGGTTGAGEGTDGGAGAGGTTGGSENTSGGTG